MCKRNSPDKNEASRCVRETPQKNYLKKEKKKRKEANTGCVRETPPIKFKKEEKNKRKKRKKHT